jgi:hypothetical protein
MVAHFIQFGSTLCRNCGLRWGIHLVIDGIVVLGVIQGDLTVGGVIVLLIGVGLPTCWAVSACKDMRSAVALQKRERY